MSRIIVKNLPKGITSKKLEDLFAAKGIITDLQLKYSKDGVFRHFAFIGYKTEEEANAAKAYFHNTFVHTSKIQVEICSSLGDPNKPKSWKNQKSIEKIEPKPLEKAPKSSEKKKTDVIPDELKNDPEFKEYLKINQARSSKPVWAEDIDTNSLNSESEDEEQANIHSGLRESEDEGKDASEIDKTEEDEKLNISKKASEDQLKESPEKQKKTFNDEFTIKIRNLPYQCKKSQIKKFFQSLKIISLRLPPKSKGFAYVSFKTEKDMKQALNKNRGFLDGHRVDVIRYIKKVDTTGNANNNRMSNENDKELNEELLADTGRIYARNLCYSVTEDDIRELFVKYGPLSEVHVPMDYLTKKAQGFAFISYMFAEHAVKAFTELDGTVFQGRMLHLIPAKPKKAYKIDENETNYKKKKEAKRKEQSESSHSWNILFLGMNAVADAVAEKYGIEKSKLLSGDSQKSVAVRMALAETEMVEKTRKFLVENGVQLDAFSQPNAERSKTVIVVKHLPAKTTAQELNDLFSKHGTISRVLLPPTGMVALIEYENPSEAKTAFRKLAYSRFHSLPLYLEWAPMDVIKEPSLVETKDEDQSDEGKEDKVEKSAEASTESPPVTGTTIYVKNINFDTTQESFEKHFKQCGPIHYANISTKKDIKTGKQLSMGFGFVQFEKKKSAVFALQNLQQSVLDGYSLELKFANRSITPASTVKRKKYEVKKQTSSKILVRNIPFQASDHEVRDLFKEFGTLRNVRLPKKLGKSGEHRGFGFIEYMNAEDAERAFESLCHSTHLFNRRLVLEWANPEADNVSELRKKTADLFDSEPKKKKMKKSQLKEDIVLAAARYNVDNKDDDEDERGD